MAIFGTKKGAKAEKGTKNPRHALTAKLGDGVAQEVIRAPWLSEKALMATEKGVYTFAVSKRSTSAEIAGAIKEIYKVSPKAVRIVNVKGKTKALRTKRGFGTRAARRKAYVYLNAGDSISLV